jgi:hypothetical protein
VQRGLELAASNARYLFLVYNGSVHHWHVSRPLQRPGLRHHLLPFMEKVSVGCPGPNESYHQAMQLTCHCLGSSLLAALKPVPRSPLARAHLHIMVNMLYQRQPAWDSLDEHAYFVHTVVGSA